MEVAVQRPLARSSESSASAVQAPYLIQTFHVELEHEHGPWHLLRSIRESSRPYTYGMPLMHRGFFDSHLHATWMGLRDSELDLLTCSNLSEMRQRISEAALERRGSTLKGHGWDESMMKLSLAQISQAFEDALPEGQSVILYRICGHAALVNRTLRQRAGKSELPVLVSDRDLPAIHEALEQSSATECRSAFLRAQDHLWNAGVSAIGDMSLDETTVTSLRMLAEKGLLKMDVQGVVDAGRAPSVESQGPLWVSPFQGGHELNPAGRLVVRHWKRYLDGSLGSRTAWLSRSYEDGETFGESLQPSTQLLAEAREALRSGFHLSFHAIGDAALDQALEVGEQLRVEMQNRRAADLQYGWPSTYHRLEHVQVVREDQLIRLREQGFWAICSQPGHRIADEHFIAQRIGFARAREHAYRLGSFKTQNICFALSSDAPIDRYEPEHVMRAALSHPLESERLSFEDLLWNYSTGSRLSLGLDPGKLGVGAKVVLTYPC